MIVRAAEQPPIAALTVAIVIVRTLAIARGSLRYAERLTGHSAVLRMLADLRGRVYAALTRRRDIREGDALTRVVSDVDAYQDGLLRCKVPAMVAAVAGTIGLAVTAMVSTPAFLVLLGGVAILGVALPLTEAKFAAGAAQRTVTARARLADHAVDLVQGAQELHVYGATERKLREAENTVAEITRAERRTLPLGALSVFVHSGTVIAVLMVTDETGPVRAALALGVLTGLEVFVPLTSAAARWVEVKPAIARVRDLLAGPPTPDRPAIDLVPDKHIGILGPSGSGKSTLLEAIARRYPQAAGAMADAHIFTTTIRANLAFARPGITQEDLDDVARLVRLDEWLRTLPDGWDTEITKDTISGGQRQRLILARALLADAPILLLDEPVESLDPQQGDEILADILAAQADRKVVLVTHRRTHLKDFDDVILLDRGKITHRGKMISHPALQSNA
jgi:ATP-binding cassette subfamily C protein CydC